MKCKWMINVGPRDDRTLPRVLAVHYLGGLIQLITANSEVEFEVF